MNLLRIASRIASSPLTEQPDYGTGGASVPRGTDPQPDDVDGEVAVTVSRDGRMKVSVAGRQVSCLQSFTIVADRDGPPAIMAEFTPTAGLSERTRRSISASAEALRSNVLVSVREG